MAKLINAGNIGMEVFIVEIVVIDERKEDDSRTEDYSFQWSTRYG